MAWGSAGGVSVKHSDESLVSDSFPYIAKGGSEGESTPVDPLDPTDIDDQTIVVPTDPMQ